MAIPGLNRITVYVERERRPTKGPFDYPLSDSSCLEEGNTLNVQGIHCTVVRIDRGQPGGPIAVWLDAGFRCEQLARCFSAS